DLRGWRYFAPGAPPDGFAVDGHMDERESAFASNGEWFVLAHGSDALLFVTRMSENLRRGVTLSLVYRDDAARPSPPEDSPGTVPLVGYRGRGIEKLPGGRYQFALHIYTLPGYRRGDERRLLAQLDARAELRGERGVEVGEQAARALGRGQEREAGGQDVGRREVVGEGPGTAGEDRQPELAPRGHAPYRLTARPKAQRGLGRTVT